MNLLALFNLSVPLNMIGDTGATISVTAGAWVVNVLGTGWTTGPVTETGLLAGGSVTFLGYDNRTPGHAGVVQLISPFRVITNFAGNLPGLAVQTLTFIGVPYAKP